MSGGRLRGLASRFVGRRDLSTEIFVSRLSFYTTDEELRNAFSSFGIIEEVRLVKDNLTGRPKGFCFVKYSSKAEAEEAVRTMDGRILRGRLIFVEIAKEHKTE